MKFSPSRAYLPPVMPHKHSRMQLFSFSTAQKSPENRPTKIEARCRDDSSALHPQKLSLSVLFLGFESFCSLTSLPLCSARQTDPSHWTLLKKSDAVRRGNRRRQTGEAGPESETGVFVFCFFCASIAMKLVVSLSSFFHGFEHRYELITM